MTTEVPPVATAAEEAGAGSFECPVCRRLRGAAEHVAPQSLDPDVLRLVMANAPGWPAERGLCRDCAARFRGALAYLRDHESGLETPGADILPTPVRIGALDEYRGRGVTIAFLDAGFYAHPDLV